LLQERQSLTSKQVKQGATQDEQFETFKKNPFKQ